MKSILLCVMLLPGARGPARKMRKFFIFVFISDLLLIFSTVYLSK